MSRSHKGSKSPGYDYWGKRKPCMGYGPDIKKITHDKERMQAKEEIRDNMHDDTFDDVRNECEAGAFDSFEIGEDE